MRRGPRLILSQAKRPVYTIVADGMWGARTFTDALIRLAGSRIRVTDPRPLHSALAGRRQRVPRPLARHHDRLARRAAGRTVHVTIAAGLLAAPDAVRVLTADVLEPPAPHAARIADALAASFGGACAAVIHYGSHAQQSGARPESAYDFFVIVGEYESAYAALAESRGLSRSPRTAARLNRILAPNVLAITFPELSPPALAKCADPLRRPTSRPPSRRPPPITSRRGGSSSTCNSHG